MLKSRVKVLAITKNRINWLTRCCSSKAASNDVEWRSASPYREIPGPSTFGLIRAFIPGGKYYKLNAMDLMTKLLNDYGEIAKLPGFSGKRDTIFLFDPNDFERVFRTEGKYPVRKGLETLEYFRGTYRKDWFEKGAGLVPT